MDVHFVRTPETRFEAVSSFPYEPHYLSHGTLRMAYIDETFDGGGSVQETFLCLHGQPTWSYLYRRMIPIFLHYTSKGLPISRRVVAPDLFGFGRSDKPVGEDAYTFDFHRNSLLHLIRTLDLRNITLVVQDWGGILGLTLPLDQPWRFSRLIVMNTAIMIGTSPGKGFEDWRAYSNRRPDLDIGALMARSCPHISPAVETAYNAPFPDLGYKAGVRAFPNLVMVDPDMMGVDVSLQTVSMYQHSDSFKAEDIFMACGTKDPVFGLPVMRDLSKIWKHGCYFSEIHDAGHFVQEWGVQVAVLAMQVFENEGRMIEGVEKVLPQKAKM